MDLCETYSEKIVDFDTGPVFWENCIGCFNELGSWAKIGFWGMLEIIILWKNVIFGSHIYFIICTHICRCMNIFLSLWLLCLLLTLWYHRF